MELPMKASCRRSFVRSRVLFWAWHRSSCHRWHRLLAYGHPAWRSSPSLLCYSARKKYVSPLWLDRECDGRWLDLQAAMSAVNTSRRLNGWVWDYIRTESTLWTGHACAWTTHQLLLDLSGLFPHELIDTSWPLALLANRDELES